MVGGLGTAQMLCWQAAHWKTFRNYVEYSTQSAQVIGRVLYT